MSEPKAVSLHFEKHWLLGTRGSWRPCWVSKVWGLGHSDRILQSLWQQEGHEVGEGESVKRLAIPVVGRGLWDFWPRSEAILFSCASFFKSKESTGQWSLGLEQIAGFALWVRWDKEIQAWWLRKLNLYFRVFVKEKVPGIWGYLWPGSCSFTLVNQEII